LTNYKAYAVYFSDNYQDEFDVEAIVIMTAKEYAEYVRAISTASYPVHFAFGTNQEIVYNSSAEVISKISTKLISEVHYNLLTEMNTTSVGHFPSIDLFISKEV
jgi:hypothetical protein